MGTAGVKVIAVVGEVTEAQVHAGRQYEWANAAPEAVARAPSAYSARGRRVRAPYSQTGVSLPDQVVCRPELSKQNLELSGTAPIGAPWTTSAAQAG